PALPFMSILDLMAAHAQSLSENSILGNTGYQPVPSGDSPDGTASASAANLDARSSATTSSIPVGGSPTGAGESPAPPIFQTGSHADKPAWKVIRIENLQ